MGGGNIGILHQSMPPRMHTCPLSSLKFPNKMTVGDPSNVVNINLETQRCFYSLLKSKFVAVLAG